MNAMNQFDLDVRVDNPGDSADAAKFPTVPCSVPCTRICTKFTCHSCTCLSCITQCPIGC